MTSPIVIDTPVETYRFDRKHEVDVKREDLACVSPGPPFAKIRGLYYTIEDLIKKGVPAVGYMDTTISMASWGVSFLCKHHNERINPVLPIKPVIYYPAYKDGSIKHNLPDHLQIWEHLGAEIHPMQATRLSIMWYKAKADLEKRYRTCHMLPQGLPSEYTVNAVAHEFARIEDVKKYKSIVICVGSGVMAGGVLRGMDWAGSTAHVYGILCSKKSERKMYEDVIGYSGILAGGLLGADIGLSIISGGYDYEERVEIETPFPCNDYYDKKAFRWLLDNYSSLPKPILFWNIGGNGDVKSGLSSNND